jgi:hypothetical protein
MVMLQQIGYLRLSRWALMPTSSDADQNPYAYGDRKSD